MQERYPTNMGKIILLLQKQDYAENTAHKTAEVIEELTRNKITENMLKCDQF